jgi:uncharacterized membrane protein
MSQRKNMKKLFIIPVLAMLTAGIFPAAISRHQVLSWQFQDFYNTFGSGKSCS